ncbi:hypothetical protein ACFL0H_01975, partial [Thermodesulfobacteriota bacterium]
WWLRVGSSLGAYDYYESGALGSSSFSATVSGLPGDGSDVFVQLWYQEAGVWKPIEFQYTAVTLIPQITGPVLGSTLTDTTVTFEWTANVTPVTDWWLQVGSGLGAYDYYDSGALGSSLSATVSGLPGDGSDVFVRLWYQEAGTWKYRDFQYTAL